jgi:glycosyltransferase involved in cell wall biosynthesis
LSPEGDDEALAANIRQLITNPELRREMGEYGRRAVEERFVPSTLAKNVSRVYDKLLGRAS